MDVNKLSDHDRKLVEECENITNPIDWDLAQQLADKAESEEARHYMTKWSTRLYRREEYDAGLL